jgi:colanic acid/amylovoran biosynthesis protein
MGGAVRRFLHIKKNWEKKGARVVVLENKPLFFHSGFKLPAFTFNERSITGELINNVTFAVFALLYGLFYVEDFHVVVCPNNDLGSMLVALLISKLRRKRAVVYIHHFEGAGVGRRLAMKLSELYSYTKKTYGSITGFLKALATKISTLLVSRFDASICVSPTYAKAFLNSQVSTNGVAKKKLEKMCKLPYKAFDDRPPVACYIGRLSRDKGIPDLLKAWQGVLTKSNANPKLILAGYDEIGINKQIENCSARSSVEYLGVVSEQEKFEILSQCRVYVTPSKNEGWSLSTSEALLCGAPVVCHNTVTLHRQWKDCPYVFLADRPEDFIGNISDLINSKQKVDCRKIREWSIKSFSTFEQIAQRELQTVLYGSHIRILLINAYSWYNKGDFAIVKGMINSLQQTIPNCKITVASLTPNVDRNHHSVDITGVLNEVTKIAECGGEPDTRSLMNAFFSAFRLILCAFLYRFLRIKPKVLNDGEEVFFQKCATSHIVLSCGGGFLNDNSLTRFLVHLFQMLFALCIGKSVIVYGQSIGPFIRRITMLITSFTLNRMKLIILRENVSRQWLRRIGVNRPPIYVTTDPSFALKAGNLDRSNEILQKESANKKQEPLIGVSIRRWRFPGDSKPMEKYQNYLRVMANSIDYLIENINAKIAVVPMCTSPNPQENDFVAIGEMLSIVRNKKKVIVITYDYSPEELSAIIGQMDMFIGTRMHANILALTNKVPLIAIAYEHKTEGVMESIGLGSWVLRIEDIKLDELLTKAKKLWKQREDVKRNIDLSLMDKRSQLSALLVKKQLSLTNV